MTPHAIRPRLSRRRVSAVVAVAITALTAIAAPAAESTKFFVSSFGSSPGATGGLFATGNGGIGGIAINHSNMSDGNGTDGWSYVADRGNNRVQAFNAAGVFQFAIGRDVVNGVTNPGASGDTNEIQRITIGGGAAGGTFTLSFGSVAPTTTAPIAFGAPAGDVDAALGALGSIGGAANVSVTGADGGPYVVEFVGARASVDQAQMTANASGLTPSGTVTVATTQDGASFEKCTNAAHCKIGTAAGGSNSARGNGGALSVIAGISIDQATGDVYVHERNPNARVQQFTADGDFVRAFGWDVVRPGGAGEVIDDLDELQTITLAADIFGSVTGGTFTLAFDDGGGLETTAPIAFDAPPSGAGSVQAALEALDAFEPGDVAVTSPNAGGAGAPGGPYTVRFTGSYATENVTQLVGNGSGLTTSAGTAGLANVATALQGGPGPGFETCTVPGDCKAATNGPLEGQFGSTTSTALRSSLDVAPGDAPNAGTLYAADMQNCRVISFDVSAPTVSSGASFGSCGTISDSQFASGRPGEIVAAADGIVYASNGNAVKRIDSQTGNFLSSIPQLGFLSSAVVTLALDPYSDRLFVGQNHAGGVLEVDVSGKPELFDDPDRIVDQHFANAGMGNQDNFPFRSLAVDPGSTRLLGTTINAFAGSAGSVHRVLVLDDVGVRPPPTVEVLGAQNVEATTATLNASINPNGVTTFPTSYRFQVSKDGINWIDKTSSELVDGTGTGNVPVLVQRPVTGLEPGTDYLMRVVTTRGTNGVAGTLTSAELPLPTDPAPPVPITGAAQQVSDIRAELTGTLNPGGRETNYWFEWGNTDLTRRVPSVPRRTTASGATMEVTESIEGLAPDSVYHYRLCAQNELSPVPLCGATQRIDTRPAVAGFDPTRSYEMATSPDKALRRGGERCGKRGAYGVDYSCVEQGWPAAAGGRVVVRTWAGIGDGNSDPGFAFDTTWDVRRRRDGGVWEGDSLVNVAPPVGGAFVLNEYVAQSANLDTHVLGSITHSLFDNGSGRIAVRRLDDNGGPRGAGWYPWIEPLWTTEGGDPFFNSRLGAVIDDSGQRLVARPLEGEESSSETPERPADRWRNVVPADGGAAAKELTPAQTSGQAVLYADAAHDWRPLDLVNECTGVLAGGPVPADAPTSLPSRTVAGEIAARDCGEGSPTDVRGATLGAGGDTTLGRTQVMAMSDGGRRVFFMSPDPSAGGTGSCGAGTLAATACPAQLYVRAYDSQGRPVVRWISRAEDELFDAPQAIGLFGNGAAYEGASRDGSVVYFRTNAPLTVDDPNGGVQLSGGHVTGNASPVSWDLYRYELPASDGDPGEGTLTRVSGGPERDADPNTNCATSAADCGGASNGIGAALRFVSDDGDRAYFVTAGRIGGVSEPINQPPAHSAAANVPGAAATANIAARNLYYYDATVNEYRFVASLPFSTDRQDLDSCASANSPAGGPPVTIGATDAALTALNSSCVHGAGSGDGIVLTTSGRLTADDTDDDFDVYVYDAEAHALTRISASPANTAAYPCVREPDPLATPQALCNADLGSMAGSAVRGGEPGGAAGGRHWNVAEDASGRMTAVYFQSRLALTSGDGNTYDPQAQAGGMDVYEWRRADGRLSLASPGTSDPAFYSGNSRDGRDVFFWTEQRISPWEIEDADGDIYSWTSRPDPQGPPPPPPDICNAFAGSCQDGADERVTTPVGSGGEGDATTGTRVKRTMIRRPSVSSRRRAARTGVMRIRVLSGVSGEVTVTARARLGGRNRIVARTTRRFARPGAANVVLRLSTVARARLGTGRRLPLQVMAEPESGHGTTLRLTLRQGDDR
jgi:hypothetical protein